jgi:hypothetical protein
MSGSWDLTALVNAADPKAGLAERHLWLVRLTEWLRHAPTTALLRTNDGTPLPAQRLRQLLRQLDQHPEPAARVRGLADAFWRDIDTPSLLADFGLGARLSFGSEQLARVQARLLPGTPETRDLGTLFKLLFEGADAAWIAALDDDNGQRALLDHCRRASASVMPQLESQGVSVNIVYDLDQLDARCQRIEALLDALLARQVAERSAETGEHYIARDRAEHQLMLQRAYGGGALIAATAFARFAIGALGLSAFWTGWWSGVNCALSFVIVMLLHWTVATKQPAMTAPALAATLPNQRSGRESTAEEIEGFDDRARQRRRGARRARLPDPARPDAAVRGLHRRAAVRQLADRRLDGELVCLPPARQRHRLEPACRGAAGRRARAALGPLVAPPRLGAGGQRVAGLHAGPGANGGGLLRAAAGGAAHHAVGGPAGGGAGRSGLGRAARAGVLVVRGGDPAHRRAQCRRQFPARLPRGAALARRARRRPLAHLRRDPAAPARAADELFAAAEVRLVCCA